MTARWFVLVESNTTGSGRLFCRAAVRAGLRPVLLARDPDRYPYVPADRIESRVVDTGSGPSVLAACTELDAAGGAVAGVTSSSEYFVGTAGEVARTLGLPHPDPAAIRDCRDKATQRSRLAAAGLPGPAFAAARSRDEAAAAAARIGFPVVVKPAAGSGSIGVRRCADPAEVAAGLPGRLGLLVVGDGSARRSAQAPGYVDPRAAGFDAAVAAALATGDAAALRDLDPARGAELLAGGVPAWRVAGHAAAGVEFDAELLRDEAPYGVGYLVAAWTAR
jgi:argininosuccinate lyase